MSPHIHIDRDAVSAFCRRIDEDIVWRVVIEDLPQLVAALDPLVPPAPRTEP